MKGLRTARPEWLAIVGSLVVAVAMVAAASCVVVAAAEDEAVASTDDLPVEDLPFDDTVIVEYLTKEERAAYATKTKEMFFHAYENYMDFGFPMDEVRPLTCKGRNTLGGFALTLVDSLDTLMVMGEKEEYEKQVKWVAENLSFDKDITVVAFEANIRFVGGLLSAHLICSDPELGVWDGYNDELLVLAEDIGRRLLEAFKTETGLPIQKVNLRDGQNWADSAYWISVADAGTWLLEYGLLSYLTGDDAFIDAAMSAALKIYDSRSNINLVGTNLNIETGHWELRTATVGSGIDSYYEYLIKYAKMFEDSFAKKMFRRLYKAAKKHLKDGPGYYEADMKTGKRMAPYMTALQCFWPGMQTLLDDEKQLNDAIETAQLYVGVWQHFGFFPEIVDIHDDNAVDARYNLRPELIESMYYIYKATGDEIWPLLASGMLDDIEENTKVPCGYASVKDVARKTLNDQMESFFLAETLKYFYLIFSDEKPYFEGKGKTGHFFTTEAHPVWLPERPGDAPAGETAGDHTEL